MGRIGILSGLVRAQSAPPPVALGDSWGAFGDSQSSGYGTGTTQNPIAALKDIWDRTQTPPTTYVVNGSGGRSLAGTDTYYGTRAERTGFTFVYFQESGDQEETGQLTAAEYGDTFDTFITEINGNTPNAKIVTETAFSFGREATQYRNWDAYNTELRARVAAWALLGTKIYISEVDRNIKALDLAIAGNVWFSSVESNSYHYKDAGNLIVALSLLDALHHPMAGLDLSGITNVTTAQKDACLQVIADYQ